LLPELFFSFWCFLFSSSSSSSSSTIQLLFVFENLLGVFFLSLFSISWKKKIIKLFFLVSILTQCFMPEISLDLVCGFMM
jgi:hypothetical protein